MKRIMISAAGSGMGKTVLTGGLIRCFMRLGLTAVPYKCGPDYIDPMFHSLISKNPCRNLDLYLQGEEGVMKTFRKTVADIKIIEGVMGFYDGVGGGIKASSYEIADLTDTPVVLAVYPDKIKGNVTEELKRLNEYREPSHIKGVIITGCDEGTYRSLSVKIKDETDLRVFGYLPADDSADFSSRHLGLVGAREIEDLQERFDHIADLLSEHADIGGLLEEAECKTLTEEENGTAALLKDTAKIRCRIAVAYDEAFSFYYEDNLDELKEAGAEPVFFSPVHDQLPDADGLYIGGGYPELYLKELSGNRELALSIKEAVRSGMPTVAECGGFLFLQRIMRDKKGDEYPMAGVFDGEAFHTDGLKRFGYLKAHADRDSLLFRASEEIPAHEFHYWDCTDNGEDLRAEKSDGRSWRFGFTSGNLYAGFPHFHFGGQYEMAERFVNKAAAYGAKRAAEKQWMSLAKPLGSLGVLEDVIINIARLRGSADVRLDKRSLIVFIGDHRVVEEGVSQSDHSVTLAVAKALGEGCSTVDHLAKNAAISVFPVDTGMADDTPPGVDNKKISRGTGNIAKGAAMTKEECALAIKAGRDMVRRLFEEGTDIVLLGEMGIGNTTACSAITSVLLEAGPAMTVGRGAGLSDDGLKRKVRTVERAIEINKPDKKDPFDVLQKLGGYEIAALCGACLEGYECNIPVMLDGFITDTAALLAVRMEPEAKNALIASHRSAEGAAGLILDELGLDTMISAGIRLGEGAGAVMALPLLDQALAVYHSGHTFDDLGIEPYVPLS